MTDYAELEKRLRARANNWERVAKLSSWPEEIIQSELDAAQLREAAAAISDLTKEKDALLTTAAALGNLKPEAVLQHVRDSIATTNQPRSESAPER